MAPQAETTEQATFYSPWPLFGRRFSSQLDESRHNFEALHPLVRAAGLDGLSSPLKDHAVQSWEVGEDDFHNKYRLFWDKDNDTFRIQENIGTTDVPSWDDRLTIGSSGELVGNFYVGDVGVSAHSALTGLIAPADDHTQYLLASAATSRAAFATNWTDLTDGGSTTLHTHDHGGLGGLSDDDHPQYLLRTDENGFYGSVVKMSDNSKSFRGITVIAVDKDHFYLEQNSGNTDEVVISLKPPAGSGGVTAHSALTGLIAPADDHPQYLLRTDENGFYGISVKQSNNLASFRGINLINFGPEFYLSQNADNTDSVTINLRDDIDDVSPPGSGEANTASNLGAGQGVFSQKVGVDLQFKSLVAGSGITLTPSATEISIETSGSGGGFYGITAKQSNGLASFSGLNVFNFGPEFYLSQNANNTDSVIINLRDDSDNEGSGSGVSSVTFTDGVRTFTGVSTLGFDHASFYLSRGSAANSAVVNTRFRGAQVSKSGDQSIASGTASNTTLTWEALRYDTEVNTANPIWSSGSNTLLTVPPGVSSVRITIGINWDDNGTAAGSGVMRQVILLKNGAGFVGSPTNQIAPTIGNNTVVNVVSAVLPVNGGDTFSIRVNQVSTAAAACDIIQANATWFAMEIVG